MPDEETNAFADAINLGVEPRPVLTTQEIYGEFFLRDGDENKSRTA